MWKSCNKIVRCIIGNKVLSLLIYVICLFFPIEFFDLNIKNVDIIEKISKSHISTEDNTLFPMMHLTILLHDFHIFHPFPQIFQINLSSQSIPPNTKKYIVFNVNIIFFLYLLILSLCLSFHFFGISFSTTLLTLQ